MSSETLRPDRSDFLLFMKPLSVLYSLTTEQKTPEYKQYKRDVVRFSEAWRQDGDVVDAKTKLDSMISNLTLGDQLETHNAIRSRIVGDFLEFLKSKWSEAGPTRDETRNALASAYEYVHSGALQLGINFKPDDDLRVKRARLQNRDSDTIYSYLGPALTEVYYIRKQLDKGGGYLQLKDRYYTDDQVPVHLPDEAGNDDLSELSDVLTAANTDDSDSFVPDSDVYFSDSD